VDIDESGLQETARLAEDKKDKLSTHIVNITDRDAVTALPEQVIARHGAVDGVINNAGIIQPFVRVQELGYDAIERVMNVNFYGTLYMTKAFLPHLLKRPEAHIVNLSSMGGFLPVPGQSLYGASKAAVKLLTEALNSELKNTNVGVTVVFPGAIGTNIAVNSGVANTLRVENVDQEKAARRTLPPSKAAEIIIDGIEQDRYRVLVGSDAAFMDFIYRLNPQRAANFIYKQMKSLLGE
jgi:short-subunit dehydrogenase